MHSVLATKMGQVLTENNIKHIKHIQAKRYSSEGLLNDVCEMSAVQNLTNVAKKKLLLDLQYLK